MNNSYTLGAMIGLELDNPMLHLLYAQAYTGCVSELIPNAGWDPFLAGVFVRILQRSSRIRWGFRGWRNLICGDVNKTIETAQRPELLVLGMKWWLYEPSAREIQI